MNSATAAWASRAFGHELQSRVISRQVLSGRQAQTAFGERYAFVPMAPQAGALSAVSIDRAGAARYAAHRLHQDAEGLQSASDLFLKLMAEKPAFGLWTAVAEAVSTGKKPSQEIALGEPASAPDSLDANERYLLTGLSLAAEGGEDGWLLEGEAEPPEVQLLFKLDHVRQFARLEEQRANVTATAPGPAGQKALRDSVRHSTIRLDAVLETMPLTIGECSRLEVGQVLELPGIEAGQLSLYAETMNGNVAISQGELGVWKGHRALKLQTPVLESFVKEIAGI
ncbi:FliM/FliN family flagellar motor switch protein [Henriciella aquimarina]|uniref:FliM/FliN family flagellar motor switch protein n=1 Tax=Henriciella aquimarina TaxID=545261 RepID=UPI000A02D9AD|nr:FliM/FliN family flagellar motor C-terminal domain-containing protein [Henriciella aquimarina]